jgi:hypothetical protein
VRFLQPTGQQQRVAQGELALAARCLTTQVVLVVVPYVHQLRVRQQVAAVRGLHSEQVVLVAQIPALQQQALPVAAVLELPEMH